MYKEFIIKGGLGNQLFILLEAYRIFLNKNYRVALNISKYENKFFKEPREFSLEKIHPNLSDEFEIRYNKFSFIKLNFIFFLEKLFSKTITKDSKEIDSYTLNYLPGRSITSGYFQYINNSTADLKALEFLKNKIKPYFSGTKINRLAIHLRRGDYLLKGHEFHGIIQTECMIREAKYILENFDFDGVTIFTDSPELFKSNMFNDLFHDVIIDKSKDDYNVLRKMSLHKGLIAANSSFSLWAGLIGEPKVFKIPSQWEYNKSSESLGIDWVDRYQSEFF